MYIRKTHWNMVRAIAWSFHKTTGIDYEELFAEASLAYCEASNHFDTAKKGTKFSTYAYLCMKTALVDFCRKEKEFRSTGVSIIHDAVELPVYEFFENYDPEVRSVLDIVMEASDDFLNSTMPKMIRGYVRNELREKGWSWSRIWDAIRKTKTDLNQTEIGGIIYK